MWMDGFCGVGVHNVNISLNHRYMQSIADVSKLSVIALIIMEAA